MGEKKNLKNIYIYFSSSISQEVSEEWMEGEGGDTERKGRKGEKREGRRYQQARICNRSPQLSSEAAVPTCPRQHFHEIGMHASHDLNILRKPCMVLVRAEFPSKVLASLLYVNRSTEGTRRTAWSDESDYQHKQASAAAVLISNLQHFLI